MPEEQRAEVLTQELAKQVAGVLGISADGIDPYVPLPELGLDSMSAVELSARVATMLDFRIPAMDFALRSGLSVIAKQALAGAEAS